ncbi:MAG: hypothetical protein ACREBT_03955 [Thermoplasmata archaeon]
MSSPNRWFAATPAQQRLRRAWAISWTIKIAAVVLFLAVLAKLSGGL